MRMVLSGELPPSLRLARERQLSSSAQTSPYTLQLHFRGQSPDIVESFDRERCVRVNLRSAILT